MILFLDFDGVLHPTIESAAGFCHLPLLQEWLIANKEVNVVIASSWRQMMSIEELRNLFNPNLHDRIISKCLNSSKNVKVEFPRYEEIMQWIYLNEYKGPWVALDDALSEFPDNLINLEVCDGLIGLTEKNLIAIHNKLSEQAAKCFYF